MMRRKAQPTAREPVAICQRLRVMDCAVNWVSRTLIFSLASMRGSGALVKGQTALTVVNGVSRQMMIMRCFIGVEVEGV
jgi:hypothetical protein